MTTKQSNKDNNAECVNLLSESMDEEIERPVTRSERATRSTTAIRLSKDEEMEQDQLDTSGPNQVALENVAVAIEEQQCQEPMETTTSVCMPIALGKRKAPENVTNKSRYAKRTKTISKDIFDNVIDDAHSETESTYSAAVITKKKKANAKKEEKHLPTTSTAFNRMMEIEDKSYLCVLGEAESNMFPRKLKFMNNSIDVMFDSNVQIWLKADDFAKALGYKTYKSVIERYVNPSFVRSYPEVLDMSRPRYGDAFRLYPVNCKIQFINMAGVMQLLIRSMVSDECVVKEDKSQKAQDADAQDVPMIAHKGFKQQTKPKLSADWINYQIQPSLIAFAEAAKGGMASTTMERRKKPQVQSLA